MSRTLLNSTNRKITGVRLKTKAGATKENKTFCEFFAGIGLVREGLQHSGWACVYANDIDAKKHEMYVARFGDDEHFHLGDVWNTDEVITHIDQSPFLATASFPCIDLSLAGNWKGFEGDHSSTFFGFAKSLDALAHRKPKVVMLENVVGFITSHEGKDFEKAIHALADLGYWMDALVLDARYFVPQSRPRVFIIGVHESLEPWTFNSPSRNLFDHDHSFHESTSPLRPTKLVSLMKSIKISTGWTSKRLPAPKVNRPDLESIIDMDEAQDWWDESAVAKHYTMMSELHQAKVNEMLANGGTFIGTIYRRKRHGSTKAEIRFDGMAGCLRTPRGGSAKQIVILIRDGKLMLRWMSPREYSRLQGVGDFPLMENRNQNLFGFGDAVCVPVIRWIDEMILTPLYERAFPQTPSTARTTASPLRPGSSP